MRLERNSTRPRRILERNFNALQTQFHTLQAHFIAPGRTLEILKLIKLKCGDL